MPVTETTRRGGWPGPRREMWGFKPTPEAVEAVTRYMAALGIDATRRGSRTRALNGILAGGSHAGQFVSLTREEADEVAYLLRVTHPTPLRTAILRKLSDALHPTQTDER